MAWWRPTADNETIKSALGEEGHERFFLLALLEHLPDQIYFKDRDSRFILCSESCAQRLGLRSAAEVIGKSDFDFFTPEFAQLGFDTEQELMNGGERIVDLEREEVHSDGRVTWASTTKMPLVAPNGETIGIFGVNRDISLRKQAEQALRASNERLAAIVQIQREIAQTELDMDAVRSLVVERTRGLAEADGAVIMLVDGDELVSAAGSGWGLEKLGARITADPKGIFRAAIENKRSQQVQSDRGVGRIGKDLDQLFEREVRSLLVVPLEHDQTVVGLLCVTRCDTNTFDEGVAESLELLSIVLSAALSNAAEFEQRRQRIEMLAQFEAIYSRAPIGIATIDAGLCVRDPNPALCELLDHERDKLEGTPIYSFISKDDRAREKRYLQSLLRGESDFYSSEARFERADGVTIWAHVAVSLVRDAGDGSRHFAIMMIENVTERHLAEEAVREQAAINEYQALHDALTGLPNRTLFHDRIQHALLTSERDGGRMAMLMMDIDRFKEVNDTLGHHAGDALLKELADRMQNALRATDTVARLGGDEFGLILPGQINPSDIVGLLEKIRRAMEPPVTIGDLPPVALEVSIGVAVYPEDGTDIESLMRHADMAMYMAKEEGKDYAFYEPPARK